MMKLNIDIDLNWIGEDYQIDDVVKWEIEQKVGELASTVLAKNEWASLQNKEQVEKAKKTFDDAVYQLESKDRAKREEVISMLRDTFSEFLKGTAYKTTKFGQPLEQTTVGDFIQSEIERFLEDKTQLLSSLINSEVDKHIKLKEFNIKQLVEDCSRKARDENVENVVKFLTKNMK